MIGRTAEPVTYLSPDMTSMNSFKVNGASLIAFHTSIPCRVGNSRDALRSDPKTSLIVFSCSSIVCQSSFA